MRTPQKDVIYVFVLEKERRLTCKFIDFDERGRVCVRNVKTGFIEKYSRARWDYMCDRFLIKTLSEEQDLIDNLPACILSLKKAKPTTSEELKLKTGKSALMVALELEKFFVKKTEKADEKTRTELFTCVREFNKLIS